MKIGFDGKRITQNFTGLGNYSRYILKILAENHPENEYKVYTSQVPAASENLQQFHAIEFKHPKKQLSKSYWRSFGLVQALKHENIELYHGLSNEIPFGLGKRNIPSVVSIHDLIFYRYPQYYPWIDRKIYEYKIRYAADHADKIIAVSQNTKSDLMNFFGVDEARIEVIYQNCDSSFRIKITDSEKKRLSTLYNLPENYLLNVGTIETRKNSLLAVKAIRDLDPDIHLVIIGKDTPYAEKVRDYAKKNDLNKRIHFLKNVSFKDLPGIYQMAKIFLYPSEYEGFGIPILEALSSGLPVIAARGSCLEEAGGVGSIYIDPKNSGELGKEIENLLNDPEQKQNMISAGYEHLEKFSDKKIADQLIQLYQNLIKC
ncbi:MAG: glycosyltransferase family 4 protein [Bacteroidetes bacterium]|nr:glycosyltransferase family 4 protein [Bacteroidota bacterium]